MAKQSNIDYIREQCESDFVAFISIVAPYLSLGAIHIEVCRWLTRQDKLDNLILLLPRSHMKSKLAAFLTAWWVTRNPTETILYVSATAALAEAQLSQIKQILTSKVYRRYWPEMVNEEEGKRSKWAVSAISVDHPLRVEEGIRDHTVTAVGLTANTTGLHASKVVLDDVVVPGNAYTEEGRLKVEQFYSQLASIENPGAEEIVVGTRYHPRDLYYTLMSMQESIFNSETQEYDERPVFESMVRVVEEDGDFLWPKSAREDGKTFGFDEDILARIKAKYIDITQFYSQYYQQPNHAGSESIDRTKFQYYDKKFLTEKEGDWYFKTDRLKTFAAVDFAFSLKRKADFTAIVVIGITHDNNYYILDIDRFKSDKIKEYYQRIERLYSKWGFRKIRAEVTVAQQAIVTELKDSYIKPQGLNLSVDEYRPNKHEGHKEERIEAILSTKYENQQIWHYNSGLTQLLEEELIMRFPPHDDIKETLSNAIAISKPPSRNNLQLLEGGYQVKFHPRFGGVL